MRSEPLYQLSFAGQIMRMAAVERRWTAREVRDLIARNPRLTPRYELVDGELLVTPSPSFVHQRTVKRLLIALENYLELHSAGEALTSPSDVELEPEFVSQPDIFVVAPSEARRLSTERFPVRALLLAVEVLSPDSARHDRVRKRPMYQRHVPVYWIVDPEARTVEIWRPSDVEPVVVADALTWQPDRASEPFRLDLMPFFARVHREG